MKKIALVTGASKGIGLALAKKLLAAGYHVLGSSRSGEVGEIDHQAFEAFSLDLSKIESINQFKENMISKNVTIDLLINNAGVGPDLDTQIPDEQLFMETFDINLKGLVFFTEAMLSFMTVGGKILNVSSKMGSVDQCESSDSPAYRMSKSALNMYTKILSNRLEGQFQVASIHPGWVKTTITESNLELARLTTEESADSMMDYIENRFKNGDFWDAERNIHLPW